MRYRVKDYGIYLNGDTVIVQVNLPITLASPIDDASKRKVTEAIRLIVDETVGEVFCSSMQKSRIYDIYGSNYGWDCGIAFAIPTGKTIASTDQFTIEMDWGDEPTGLSGGDAAEQVKDFFHIVKDGDTVKVVTEDGGEEVVVPVELATEQEVKDINDDVMGALYGYGKVSVTMHSLMRTGAETTQDLASVIYVDPEKTWSENGFPTLYDDEGNAIDTTTNPAQGDEVFNYQIQSES